MTDIIRPDYDMIRKQYNELIKATSNLTSRMSTLAALLHSNMKQNSWTGFYLYSEEQLIVGPFQGPVACLNLKKDTGVCWASFNEKKTIVVENVHEFPGHIACDASSCSEVVVPCFDSNGDVYAVLDIDSHSYNAFDTEDGLQLEKIVALLNN